MRASRRALLSFVAALVLWTAAGWAWVEVTGNAHVCSLLQAPGPDGRQPELTEAEQIELTRERCGPRASLGDILLVATGYVVIVTGFALYATRPMERPEA